MFCTLALQVLGAATAEAGLVRHLGQPCRARQVNASLLIADRHDGRPRLALCNMNEVSGLELVLVDFENDTAEVFRAPAGQGAWGLLEVPGDRLVIGTFYDGVFLVFDLKQKTFVHVADFPGETYIWSLALGGDGRVYGGTYPNGKLGALDLDTYNVEDLGNPAPPNMYLRQVSALPDGRLYCWSGMEKPAAHLYDPNAKSFATAPEALSRHQAVDCWKDRVVVGDEAFDGETLEPVAVPYPAPPGRVPLEDGKAAWNVSTRASTAETLVLQAGKRAYCYRPGDDQLTLLADIDLRGGYIAGVLDDDTSVGLRGQDYFLLRPGDRAPDLRRIPGESGPRGSHFIAFDGDRTLWGGPTFGQTVWRLDVESRAYENTGVVCDAGGEVYDAAFGDGVTWLVAYSGGHVLKYDPSKPWNQWDHENPKPLAVLSGRGYIRPVGGVVLGEDGMLYSGWMAKYGVYGGALAVTGPATGDTRLIENPLGPYGVSGVAVHDGRAYLGTTLGGNGLPVQEDKSAQFGVIDIATGNVLHREDVPGRQVAGVDREPETGLVIMNAQGQLRVFDPDAVVLRAGDDALPRIDSHGVAVPGDGAVLYGHGDTLVRVDIASGAVEVWATLPDKVTHVARAVQGAVYVACGPDVYAVAYTR